ncbi:hypothetical protein N7476_002766 [Penicillium atrosanguineum]|uniref:Uncharacterized protein n=1 Tax=Penicillium atrosanguineum TaxID=1132637 RepID=A0A9W9U7U4_9EURO|nr:hypothetical protein N7476_002766 [Penicillium atrosanguineum]
MSSTTTQTITQRGLVYTKMEKDDFLKDKIIEHFSQLTLDPDFQKASATYSQIKEQQEQIRIRDAKLAKLEKDFKAQEGNKVLALSELSAVNQVLTTQKGEAETKNSSLRKEATEREKSLTEVSRRIKELQSQIQAQLLEKSSDEKNMNSMVEKHNLDIDSLQRRLKESDGVTGNIKATNVNLTSLLAVEKTKTGRLEEEKKSLDEEMQKARSRLEKLDGFIFESHKVDEQSMSVFSRKMSYTLLTLCFRMDDFSGLWGYAKNEIWTVLRQDLSEENLRNERPWKKLRLGADDAFRDGAIHGQSVPLCASNSDAAKGMRLAVMLAILSREIDKEIFQPNYFPSDTGHFRMSLNKLVQSDNEKEHFYRSVLLSIDRDAQGAELQSRVKCVVQKVSCYLEELLSTAQYAELKEKIKNVVDRATEVWHPIQQATKRYETEFHPIDWVHDEDELFQYPIGDNSIAADVPYDHLFVIFPGLSSLEENVFILTSVIPLLSSQRLCLVAKEELREAVRGKSSSTAKQGNRKRQNSVAIAQPQQNGRSFLGGYSREDSGN